MRFIIFIIWMYVSFQSTSFLLGEHKYFLEDDLFHVVFIPDVDAEVKQLTIVELEDLQSSIFTYPNYGLIPESEKGYVLHKKDNILNRVEYELEEINENYSRVRVAYSHKNNMIYSNYLVENNEVHPLYTSAPRSGLLITYIVLMIILALLMTAFSVAVLEPRYKKYIKELDAGFTLYISSSTKVRLCVRSILVCYLIPSALLFAEIVNSSKEAIDFIFVGIFSAFLASILVAAIALNNKAIKLIVVLVVLIILFPDHQLLQG